MYLYSLILVIASFGVLFAAAGLALGVVRVSVKNVTAIFVTMLILSIAMALAGCQQTPLYRLPTNSPSYRLPPCSATITPGTPCAPLVVKVPVSACEKRFGKICNRKVAP